MSTLKVVRVDHVAVQTADIERALHFYVNVLGAELQERRKFKMREMAWLRVAGMRIELFSVREGERLEQWSDFHPGPVHLAFVVEDLDAFLSHADEHGIRLHPSHPSPFVPPVAGAGRMAYLLGPDGEEVEIRTA